MQKITEVVKRGNTNIMQRSLEMAFSKLKAHLRRIGAKTIEDLNKAIASILDLYPPHECANYFTAAGYLTAFEV